MKDNVFLFVNQKLSENCLSNDKLEVVEVHPIVIDTTFRNFDDYWSPFLGGQGPASSYTMSLSEERRVALREHIRLTLPIAHDGSIHLVARAWAVRGFRKTKES